RSVILTGDVVLQEVDERRGVTNQMLVKLAHRDRVEEAAAAINGMVYETDLHAETQQVARDQAGSDLAEMLRYAAHVIAVVAVVILVGLANATSMAVRERVREVGVLRAIGFSRRRIVSLIALESLALSVAGGALGLLAAWATLTFGGISISVGNYAFPVTMSVVLTAVAITGAATVGILGALPAGVRASRRPIVDALRSAE
ncbi:MAG: ABC transporter permease, partial [Planctomycetota bacterium]